MAFYKLQESCAVGINDVTPGPAYRVRS